MTNKENKMPPHRVKSDINLSNDDKVADFKTLGIATDNIAESTPGAGVSVSDVLKTDVPRSVSRCRIVVAVAVGVECVEVFL